MEGYTKDTRNCTRGHELSEKHRAVLAASAVDTTLLEDCPARSTPGGADLKGLRFSEGARKRGPGMLFTYPHPDGTTSNLFRPDDPGDGPKYWQESIKHGGAGNRLGVHPRQRDLIGRVGVPVLFVEGWKKLLSIVSALEAEGRLGEVLVLCVSGTWNWVRRGKIPIDDLLGLPVEGAEATVWYDSDLSLKWQVEDACRGLCAHLDGRGADVSVVISPPMPDGSKRGADDHLANGGTLRQALEDWSVRWTPETFAVSTRVDRVPGLLEAIEEAASILFDRPFSGRGDPAEHKVLRELLRLAPERGRPVEDGLRVDVSCRRLTELIAASSRTLYRAVQRLQQAGIIRKIAQTKGRSSGGFVILRAKVRQYGKGSRLSHQVRDFTDALCRGVLPLRAPSLMESSPGWKPSKKRIAQARKTGRTLPPAREPVSRPGAVVGQALDAYDACERAELGHAPSDAQIAAALGIKRARDYARRVKPRMTEAGLLTEDGRLAREPSWLARLEEVRELGGEIDALALVKRRHARERERFRRRRSRTGDTRGPTDAGIANIRRSREKREEHLRNPRPSEATKQPGNLAKEARVRKLVRTGMAERFARASVYGEGA